MNEEKSHVGRHTIEEGRKRNIKKILKDILYIIIGIAILGFLTTSLDIKFDSFHIVLGVILVLIWFVKRRL